MRHFVFMRFEKDYFDKAVFEYIEETFSRLQSVLPEEILACRVRQNCVERESNMDLMIEMELKNRQSLELYLKHPLHLAIGERMNSYITSRCSFDCE